jgi:hypothetical protein
MRLASRTRLRVTYGIAKVGLEVLDQAARVGDAVALGVGAGVRCGVIRANGG